MSDKPTPLPLVRPGMRAVGYDGDSGTVVDVTEKFCVVEIESEASHTHGKRVAIDWQDVQLLGAVPDLVPIGTTRDAPPAPEPMHPSLKPQVRRDEHDWPVNEYYDDPERLMRALIAALHDEPYDATNRACAIIWNALERNSTSHPVDWKKMMRRYYAVREVIALVPGMPPAPRPVSPIGEKAVSTIVDGPAPAIADTAPPMGDTDHADQVHNAIKADPDDWQPECIDGLLTSEPFFALLNMMDEWHHLIRQNEGIVNGIQAAIYHFIRQTPEKVQSLLDDWGETKAIAETCGKPRAAGFSTPLVELARQRVKAGAA